MTFTFASGFIVTANVQVQAALPTIVNIVVAADSEPRGIDGCISMLLPVVLAASGATSRYKVTPWH